MSLSKFSDYYINSLVKDPNKDYNFDDSDKWYSDHIAITSRGSIALGIIGENSDSFFRNFIDINILPEIFNAVKKNETDSFIFLTKQTKIENFIYESLCKKFPQKIFPLRISKGNVTKEIRIIELENKAAITILESSEIFSIKHIIEYI